MRTLFTMAIFALMGLSSLDASAKQQGKDLEYEVDCMINRSRVIEEYPDATEGIETEVTNLPYRDGDEIRTSLRMKVGSVSIHIQGDGPARIVSLALSGPVRASVRAPFMDTDTAWSNPVVEAPVTINGVSQIISAVCSLSRIRPSAREGR